LFAEAKPKFDATKQINFNSIARMRGTNDGMLARTAVTANSETISSMHSNDGLMVYFDKSS
jgi:hypothetical protein